MNLIALNKAIAGLNPYDEADKPLLRLYITMRRKLTKEISQSINDILADRVPESLKPQSGV